MNKKKKKKSDGQAAAAATAITNDQCLGHYFASHRLFMRNQFGEELLAMRPKFHLHNCHRENLSFSI